MLKILHQIVSVIMAFVVMISTTTFTFNMHFCGDTLVETALYKKAKGCGMEMSMAITDSCDSTKKNCCDDTQQSISGQDELQLAAAQLSFENQLFITSYLQTFIGLFETFDYTKSSYQDYKPPLVIRKLFKLDETYLI